MSYLGSPCKHLYVWQISEVKLFVDGCDELWKPLEQDIMDAESFLVALLDLEKAVVQDFQDGKV